MGCCGLWSAARTRFNDAEDGSDSCAPTPMTPPTSAVMTTSSVHTAFCVPRDMAAHIVIGERRLRTIAVDESGGRVNLRRASDGPECALHGEPVCRWSPIAG